MYVYQCRPHPAYVLFVFDIQGGPRGGPREDFGLWLISDFKILCQWIKVAISALVEG
jgi:hypothetical protein